MSVSCSLCNRNDYSEIKQISGSYYLIKCNNCGLVYINPQPSLEEIKSLYNSREYFEPKQQFYLRAKASKAQRRFFTMWLNRIEKERTIGRILDIGCAGGEFLGLARSRGWEVTGVEVSEYAAGEARSRFGLDVYEGTLEEAEFASESFDVVNLAEVIEHVPDPLGLLSEIRRVLRAGGLLMLSTPNVRRLTWGRNKEDFPHHLYEFSTKTLSRLVSEAGFVNIRILSNTRLRNYLAGGVLKRTARYLRFGAVKIIFFITDGKLNWSQSIDLFASKSVGDAE